MGNDWYVSVFTIGIAVGAVLFSDPLSEEFSDAVKLSEKDIKEEACDEIQRVIEAMNEVTLSKDISLDPGVCIIELDVKDKVSTPNLKYELLRQLEM